MSEKDPVQPEAIITDEELELEEELEDTEDVDWKAEAEKNKQFARQAVARAKKAEAENKVLKEKPTENSTEAPRATSKDVLTPEDVDMRILKLGGMSDELLGHLKKVAAVTGKSLIDAQTDPVFVGIKDKLDTDKKAEQARLGASRGSGSQKKMKDLNTPGLSDEEHKELWKKHNGLI